MDRRRFISGLAGLTAGCVLPSSTRAQTDSGLFNAADFDVRPGSTDDQTARFSALLAKASSARGQVFLPPGTYVLSAVDLPSYVNLLGIAGQTRILLGGNAPVMSAKGCQHVQLSGLVHDGNQRALGSNVRGLIEFASVDHLVIEDCQFVGAGKNAVDLFKCAGRIEKTRISGAGDAAIFAADSTGLRIAGNTISDCGNGGILVQRYEKGRDATIVQGNRIARIRADAGGTGQNGNGINVFRADNVIVSGNVVDQCAFSAIRGNSASDLQIMGNNCTDSGETAIYSEFAFEAAVISDNLVDGAANGISIANFDSGGRLGTCTGNIVRNLSSKGPYPGEFGVGIAAEADVTISGNVIENAPLYGIQLGWGTYMRNLVASGNIIRASGEGIYASVVKGVGTAIITGNIIQDTRHGGIVGHHWADVAIKDLTAQGSAPQHFIVEGNSIS